MPVRFNKYVLISNPRLECLYLFFCLVLAACLVFKFYYWQEHVIFYEADEFVQVSITPVVEHADLQSVYDAQADTCAQLSGDCVRPCESGDDFRFKDDGSPSCAFPQHLAIQLNSLYGDSVMFPTSIEHHELPSVGDSSVSYYPYEEAVGLRLRISVRNPKSSFQSILADKSADIETTTIGTSDEHGVLVMFLDRMGRFDRVVDGRPEEIHMSMITLLDMAGLGSEYLENVQAAGDEMLIGRDVGASLRLETECYDGPGVWGFHSREIYDKFKDSEAAILCTVRAVVGELSGSFINGPYVAKGRDEVNGVAVLVSTGGHMSQISLASILDAAVQTVVFAQIPKFLALMVTVGLLGHLSRIYKPIIFEVFDIAEQVAGTAARLISNTVSFEELCQHKESFISRETIQRRIGLATKHSTDFTTDELEVFVDFSHKAFKDLGYFTKYDTLSKEVREDAKKMLKVRSLKPLRSRFHSKRTSEEPIDSSEHVCLHNFTRGCSSIDKMYIEDTIHLFSRKRQVKRLERLFMPAYIRHFVRTWEKTSPTESLTAESIAHTSSLRVAEMIERSPSMQHRTQGARAYDKILELENRYKELEGVALSNGLQSNIRELERRHEEAVAELHRSHVPADTFKRSVEELQRQNKELDELLKARTAPPDLESSLAQILLVDETDGERKVTPRDVADDRKLLQDLIASRKAADETAAEASKAMQQETSKFLQQLRREVGADIAEAVQDIRSVVLMDWQAYLQGARVVLQEDAEKAVEACVLRFQGSAPAASGTRASSAVPSPVRPHQCQRQQPERQPTLIPRRESGQAGFFLGGSLVPSADAPPVLAGDTGTLSLDPMVCFLGGALKALQQSDGVEPGIPSGLSPVSK